MLIAIPDTAPSIDPMVDGRKLSEYTDKAQPGTPGHRHSLDDIVGYAVRRTIGPDGRQLWHLDGSGRCGFDVAVVQGANQYGWAVEAANTERVTGWAVIDNLYRCGCRGQG